MTEGKVTEEIKELLTAIRETQTTCHGEDCNRLDLIAEQLKGLEAVVSAKTSETIDAKFEALRESISEIKSALADVKANPVVELKETIPDSAYFECPECSTPLDLEHDICPNADCKALVDWPSTFQAILATRPKKV